MRGKVKEDLHEDRYGYLMPEKNKFESKKRLDLNDLLKRMEDQKKSDKKLNHLILSSAAGIVAVVILFFTLYS